MVMVTIIAMTPGTEVRVETAGHPTIKATVKDKSSSVDGSAEAEAREAVPPEEAILRNQVQAEEGLLPWIAMR